MPRTRRILKWTGLVLSILFAAAWVGTAVWAVDNSRRSTAISVGYGSVSWMHSDRISVTPWRGWRFESFDLWWAYHRFLPKWNTLGGRGFILNVPLWIPLLIVATPTFIAWRRDRKLPPGHCACGFNLTGNVSGRCPECGAKVEG